MKSAIIGDIVLIYLSRPHSCIKYVCKIKDVNKPQPTIDDNDYIVTGDNYVDYGNYMQLELLENIKEPLLIFENLKLHRLKGNIQGSRSLKDNLLNFILEKVNPFLNSSNKNEYELENVEYKEGKIQVRYGVKFERNPKLRQKAVEIHHIKSMYNVRKEISVNSKIDLVPLCSNCHKMIHRNKEKPLTIEELKERIIY
ncbi:HNH endonuclease [Staphylococcus equorum]